jgi:hypothetical protein
MTTKPSDQTTQPKTSAKNGADVVRDAVRKIERIIHGLSREESARVMAATAMLAGFYPEAQAFIAVAMRSSEAQS